MSVKNSKDSNPLVEEKVENEIVVPEDSEEVAPVKPSKKAPKAEVSITIKPPKVEKPVKEKKELTEGQKNALAKMNEARVKKAEERKAILKENADLAKQEREEAVKKAEADAKKVTEDVVVQKVRGRKEGTKIPPKEEPIRRAKPVPKEEPRQMTYHEYAIHALRQRGINVSDDASPYTIKLMMARMR